MVKIDKTQTEGNFYITKLVEKGSEITGRVGAGLVGGILGGFPGIVIGAAYGSIMGELLKNAGYAVQSWFMGERQEMRVGATYIYGAQKIQELLTEGKQLRQDEFFASNKTNRSAADEILEGVLLKSQNEYEELKLKHYGYFLANLSFRPDINRSYANFLLRLSEKLSFFQFCLLSVLDNEEKYQLLIRHIRSPEEQQFIGSLRDFKNYQLLSKSTEISIPSSPAIKIEPSWVSLIKSEESQPSYVTVELNELFKYDLVSNEEKSVIQYHNLKLTPMGKLLRSLLELDDIDSYEINPLINFMVYKEQAPDPKGYTWV